MTPRQLNSSSFARLLSIRMKIKSPLLSRRIPQTSSRMQALQLTAKYWWFIAQRVSISLISKREFNSRRAGSMISVELTIQTAESLTITWVTSSIALSIIMLILKWRHLLWQTSRKERLVQVSSKSTSLRELHLSSSLYMVKSLTKRMAQPKTLSSLTWFKESWKTSLHQSLLTTRRMNLSLLWFLVTSNSTSTKRHSSLSTYIRHVRILK